MGNLVIGCEKLGGGGKLLNESGSNTYALVDEIADFLERCVFIALRRRSWLDSSSALSRNSSMLSCIIAL